MAPREVNAEADALSNFRFVSFNPAKRVELDMESLPFLVLPQRQQQASLFYAEARAQGKPKRAHRGRKRTADQKLRERDPW